jgi:hypothetical protein
MVFRPAHRESLEAILAGYAAQKLPKLLLRICRDQIAALFGGEYAVD